MAHQQTISAHAPGRLLRQHSTPSQADIREGPNNIASSPCTAIQLDIDRLSKGLGSVELKDYSGAPATPAPRSLPAKARSASTVKPTSKAKAAARKSTIVPQPHQEPPIVRRSRRGDKAISHHPHVGRYRIELTSSERLWCGKYALGISTEQQLGTRLTVEDFDEIFASEESGAFNRKHGWVGVEGTARNFYDEQLDLVLRIWGRRRGWWLRLGVVRDFEGAFVNGAPGGEEADEREDEGDCTTVWIHNDNAILLGRPFNHYSGISVLERAY